MILVYIGMSLMVFNKGILIQTFLNLDSRSYSIGVLVFLKSNLSG